MVFLDRFYRTLATVLAGLLAFIFGPRLDEWIAGQELPADRPRLVSWHRRAACAHRPIFAGGTMIQAKAA